MLQPHDSPEDENIDYDDESVEAPQKLPRRSKRPKPSDTRLKPSFENKV